MTGDPAHPRATTGKQGPLVAHPVPDTSDRLDVVGTGPELLAQADDLDIHRALRYGVVVAADRIEYLRLYLIEARNALRIGVRLGGYFVWTLLDNFEWAFGFTRRFGLVRMDFPTLRRIPKASAHWYRDLIERGGAGLDD